MKSIIGATYGNITRMNLNENTKTVSQLTASVNELKIQQSDFKKELMSLKVNTQASIRALESSQHKIADSQKFISEEFEKFKNRLDTVEERAKTAEANVIKTNADIQIIHEELQSQQDHTNALEQYGRRNMLEINNIPVKNEENMEAIIRAVATAMKYDTFNYDTDVDVAHRLQSKLNIPPIIVLFKNRSRRNEFYEQRKKLKGITLQDLELNFEEQTSIFINESLTIHNRILFRKVREKCKENQYKYYWTVNGVVMCKKNYQNDPITIKNQRDITKIK